MIHKHRHKYSWMNLIDRGLRYDEFYSDEFYSDVLRNNINLIFDIS
jgi:hypothetical protein